MKKIKLSDRPELKEINTDHMPVEVAREMLSSPVRLSNSMRKNCIAARSRFFVATATRRPIDGKLAAKLKTAKLTQLGNWLRRSVTRRADVQRAFVRVTGTTPVHDRIRAALELKAAEYDIMRDAVETELLERSMGVDEVIRRHVEENGRLHCWQRKPLSIALGAPVRAS